LKQSVFLATVLAAAVVLTLPVGGTGAAIGAPGLPSGSGANFVVGSNAVAASQAVVAASRTHTVASAPVAGDGAQGGASSKEWQAEKDATGATAGGHSSASTQSNERAIQASRQRSTPGVGARLAGSSGRGKTLTRKPKSSSTTSSAPECPSNVSGGTNGAPGDVSKGGVQGTTSADIASFALAYNSIRVAHCLKPVPLANIKFSSCLEQRMFWMAEDPSTNPASAWGHTGTAKRSDGVAIVGCDGDIAGGMNDTGAVDAQSWWDSPDHRDSLYQPLYKGSTSNVCIAFGMAHGGIPNDPAAFTRAAAVWEDC
jgi:hypothetical protein